MTAMEISNEQTEETARLTIADLGVAAWACSELFNYMLEGYEQEEYGDLSKEQIEEAMNKLRATFVKLDALATTLSKENENESSAAE
jgi:hypothetical protein